MPVALPGQAGQRAEANENGQQAVHAYPLREEEPEPGVGDGDREPAEGCYRDEEDGARGENALSSHGGARRLTLETVAGSVES